MVPKLSRDTKHKSNHHNLHLLGVFLAALQQRRASCSVRWVAGGRGFRGQQCVKENLRGKNRQIKKFTAHVGWKVHQNVQNFWAIIMWAEMSFFPKTCGFLARKHRHFPLKEGYINIPVIVPVRRWPQWGGVGWSIWYFALEHVAWLGISEIHLHSVVHRPASSIR